MDLKKGKLTISASICGDEVAGYRAVVEWRLTGEKPRRVATLERFATKAAATEAAIEEANKIEAALVKNCKASGVTLGPLRTFNIHDGGKP